MNGAMTLAFWRRKKINGEAKGASKESGGFPATLIVVTSIAVVPVAIWAYGFERKMVATAIVVAGASVAVGALAGLLFGVPRPSDPVTDPPADSDAPRRHAFGMNTNLGEVSDWLTKMLVGVGLTQINKLPAALGSLSRAVGDPNAAGSVFAGALMIYLAIFGFIAGWLCSVLRLPSELSNAIERRARDKVERDAETVVDRAQAYEREVLTALDAVATAEQVGIRREGGPDRPDATFTKDGTLWRVEVKYRSNRLGRAEVMNEVARLAPGERLLLVAQAFSKPAVEWAQATPAVRLVTWAGRQDDGALRAAITA